MVKQVQWSQDDISTRTVPSEQHRSRSPTQAQRLRAGLLAVRPRSTFPPNIAKPTELSASRGRRGVQRLLMKVEAARWYATRAMFLAALEGFFGADLRTQPRTGNARRGHCKSR